MTSKQTKGGRQAAPSPDIDLARWCKALATQRVSDVVPSGWLTATELSEKIGVSVTEARRRIRAAINNGSIESQKAA